jgi:FMN phosphatase YigB (HAD superfamily)
MQGRRRSSEICRYLCNHLPFTFGQLSEVLEASCRALRFNPAVEALARQLQTDGVPTALVTVNMDCFSELVVPHHRLGELFDVVVNSADHDSLDKRDLWPLAFEALDVPSGYAGSWLIDDSVRNVETFRRLGGRAILYVDDPHFRRQLVRNGFCCPEAPDGPLPG